MTRVTLHKALEDIDGGSMHQVLLALSEIGLYQSNIFFPSHADDIRCSCDDYDYFLTQLHTKFKELKPDHVPKNMVFSCCDEAALNGLIAYGEKNLILPFQTLTLNLDAYDVGTAASVSHFLTSMEQALLLMSERGLSVLKLKNDKGHLSAEIMSELSARIIARGIAVEIELPAALQATEQQKQLDIATAENIRLKRMTHSKETLLKEAETHMLMPAIPRRRPKRDSKQGAMIEVELEQEHEQWVAISSNTTEGGVELVGVEMMGLEAFQEAMQSAAFPLSTKSFLLNSDRESCATLWCCWLGFLSLDEAIKPSSMKISKSALEKLLQYHPLFQAGIDLKHLPPGFILITEDETTCLHFDETWLAVSAPDPLQIQMKDESPLEPFPFSLLSRGIATLPSSHPIKHVWDRLERAPYDKAAYGAFRQYFPALMSLSEPALVSLFEIVFPMGKALDPNALAFFIDNRSALKSKLARCLEDSSLVKALAFFSPPEGIKAREFLRHDEDVSHEVHLLFKYLEGTKDSLEQLLQKVPDLNLNALLALYVQYGEQGILDFKTLVDSDTAFFQSHNTWLFKHLKTLSPLLGKDYQDAMKTIAGFSREERSWWDVLLHQQSPAVTSLIDLVDAFMAFKRELQALPTHDGKSLAFSAVCELKGEQLLCVTLSRILELLKHCSIENRQAEWRDVSGLDLSSTGALLPLSRSHGHDWAFVTPEMQLTASAHTTDEGGEYLPPARWKQIADVSLDNIRKNFFRYVACQEHYGQLPLAFYHEIDEVLRRSGLSFAVLEKLYPLIAAATTTKQNVRGLTLIEARSYVNQLIAKISNISIPMIPKSAKEQVRLKVCETLYELNSIPSLATLTRLVALVVDNLSSRQRFAQMRRVNKDFKRSVSLYGNAVYEGISAFKDDHIDLFKTMDKMNKIGCPVIIRSSEPTKDEQASGIVFVRTKEGRVIMGTPTTEGHYEFKEVHDERIKRLIDQRRSHGGLTEGGDLEALNACLAAWHPPHPPVMRFFGEGHHEEEEHFIALLSVFQLTITDLTRIATRAFAEDVIPKRRVDALRLLRQISRPGKDALRALNADDLLSILDAVNRTDEPVAGVFQRLKLSDEVPLVLYYPLDFLSQYEKKDLSLHLKRTLAEHFDEHQRAQIKAMLQRFCAEGDAQHYEALVNKLILICQPMSMLDKKTFISTLTSTSALYTPLTRLDDEKNEIVRVLDALLVHHNPNVLIQLITPRQGCHRPVEHLATRARLLICDILPDLEHWFHPGITDLELAPRIHEIVLKTPVEELRSSSALCRFERVAIENGMRVLDTLAGCLIDGTTIHFLESVEAMRVMGEGPFKAFSEALHTHHLSTTAGHFSSNIRMRLLLKYLKNKEDMTRMERIFMDDKRSRVDALIRKYASILANEDLIDVLLKNPSFMHQLTQPGVLEASMSSDLLDSDEKLELFFKSLAADLETVSAFRAQVILLQDTLKIQAEKLTTYPHALILLTRKMNDIALENVGCKAAFLDLLDTHLKHYSPRTHGPLLTYLDHFVTQLGQSFDGILDKKQILSLCVHFNRTDDETIKPEGLLALFQAIEHAPEAQRFLLLKIVVTLLNHDHVNTMETFPELCNLAQDPACAEALHMIYAKPPYPSVMQVLEWNTQAKSTGDYQAQMHAFYAVYNKTSGERNPLNGFHVEKARTQLTQFIGFDPSAADLEAIFAKTQLMREKTTDELLVVYKQFNQKHPRFDSRLPVDYDTLVAVAAELLYRSMGMEINTTQYLALLSSLKTPGHVTSQVGTGEGKSRIMMIAMACRHAQGKTVDFVTSDMSLARRDFIEYQPFFEVIEARTSLIFSETDPADYHVGGVHFSDPSHLSLFRNKARSLGLGERVIDPDETNRALLLDEADKTYFDVANTRFNIAMQSNDSIRGMAWVYSVLMTYFSNEHAFRLFHEDVDRSCADFLYYANAHCTEKQWMQLKALPNLQIEQWQASAVFATTLKYQDDFVLDPEVLVSTQTGPKMSSQAHLLLGNRVSLQSKLSSGVHQCLHARLNLHLEQRALESDEGLREALAGCEHAFDVPDEKQIIYSSTHKDLLDDYDAGTLNAVTGTSGSMLEREEAKAMYGLTTEGMHFIDVPREGGLHRRDRALRLTRNSEQQRATLLLQIKEALQKEQPVLIIAENEKESAFLYRALGELLTTDRPIQHIHAQLSPKEENVRLARAGCAGQVTISTDRMGRGIDIALDERASRHGLNVMVTYLPKPRDLLQIIGRSGRFGARCESSLVLDKARLRKSLGVNKLGSAFYSNVEAAIDREQAFIDQCSQCERLIKSFVGSFRKSITHSFFEGLMQDLDKANYKKMLPVWTSFFDTSDKAWNERWPTLQAGFRALPMDVALLEEQLLEYQTIVQKAWNALRQKVQNSGVMGKDESTLLSVLPENVPSLSLTDTMRALLMKRIAVSSRQKIYDHYDPGHAGRAVSYSHWSVSVKASAKGYLNLLPGVHFEEARPPFANFRAFREGRGHLLPELRAKILKRYKEERKTRNPEIISHEDEISKKGPVAS